MKALRLFLWLFFVTGVVYPLAITLFAFLLFPESSGGSFIYREDKAIGSKLIGQKFEGAKYFHSRPSATGYSTLPSSGSNFGPISASLKELAVDKKRPPDLIFQSGSGLDPHITVESALFQVKRIAAERNMTEASLMELIRSHTEYGSYVNVLLLNLSLEGYAR